MDYSELAKQYGGAPAAPASGNTDYAALAQQFGGASQEAPKPEKPQDGLNIWPSNVIRTGYETIRDNTPNKFLQRIGGDIAQSLGTRAQNVATQFGNIAQANEKDTGFAQESPLLNKLPQGAQNAINYGVQGGANILSQGVLALADTIGSVLKEAGAVGKQELDGIAPGFLQSVKDTAYNEIIPAIGKVKVKDAISSAPLLGAPLQGSPSDSDLTLGDVFGNAVNKWQEFKAKDPAAAQSAADALNILASLPIKGMANRVYNDIKEFKAAPRTELPALKPAESEAKLLGPSKLEQRYIRQAEEQWLSVGEKNAKSNKILNRSDRSAQNPIRQLSNRGIDPRDYLENGKLNTKELADRFRNQETKVAEDVLDRSLQQVDRARVADDIEALRSRALANAERANTTPGNKVRMKNAINAEFDAMKEQGGGSLKLQQQNAYKRQYWRDTFGDRIEVNNLESSANYQVGKALKESIESGVKDVTDAVQIQGLNKYLGELYNTANFVQALDGKKLPTTFLGSLGRTTAKLAGTALGSNVGGTAGGVAGYYAGRTLGDMVAEMPNPLRTYVLRDLQLNDPQILKDAGIWLKQQAEEQASRRMLPAPKPAGSAENPIITAPPTTYEGQAQNSLYAKPEPQKLLPAPRPASEVPIPMGGEVPYVGEK